MFPLSLSPACLRQVTLALDSQALCCASGVEDILKLGPGEFDIAFAVQVSAYGFNSLKTFKCGMETLHSHAYGNLG